MASIDQIRASDGGGNANVATVQSSRSPGSSTIIVDTVLNIGDKFMGSMGTPHTFTDPVTSEVITVISEATAVDFSGHVDGANLEIDDIAPGYTDLGSDVGDIIIIRPTTQYADNVADVLDASHDDDGTILPEAVALALETNGVLGNIEFYSANDTWTKPTGLKFVEVELRAGGGAGGGAGTSAGLKTAGGGGQGERAIKKIAAADMAATVAVTVGTGQTGVTGENAPSNNGGGTSSFGAHVTALGGGRAEGTNGTTTSRPGGKGGTGGTGGDLQIPGDPGGEARAGGAGHGGGGGAGIGKNGNGAGEAATHGDGGGGGGSQDSGTTTRAGGNGGNGYVIVKEFF